MRYPVILLPGIVTPADLTYAALIPALGDDVDAHPQDLAVYAGDAPPPDFTLMTEVEAIARSADDAGAERFHLVGYSGGGAAALAFCSVHPDRLVSLTLNEPAWAGNEGRSPAEQARWDRYDEIFAGPPEQMMPAFVRAQLRDGVEPPPPPSEPPPPWMAKRPAGIDAFSRAFKAFTVDLDALRAFERPVLYTIGGRSHPDQFGEIATRLASIFPDFRLEVFAERHHFDPPHRAEPETFARLLRAHWARAEG